MPERTEKSMDISGILHVLAEVIHENERLNKELENETNISSMYKKLYEELKFQEPTALDSQKEECLNEII